MIKRIVGVLFALGVVAVIVFTVLGRGGYSSLIADGAAGATVETVAE